MKRETRNLTQEVLVEVLASLPVEKRKPRFILPELDEKHNVVVSRITLWKKMRDWDLLRDRVLEPVLHEKKTEFARDAVARAFAKESAAELNAGIEAHNEADDLIRKMIVRANAILETATMEGDARSAALLLNAIEKLMLACSKVRMDMADIKAASPEKPAQAEPRFVGDNVVDAAAEFQKYARQ
jgi:hypothetical protein